jgi:branched-chain amino acid transport system substrate-binding protein
MIKTPENDRFVAEFKKRMGYLPSNEGPNGYVGMHAIADAVKALNGDLKDTPKFITALKDVKFASPKGPIKLDKYGMVIQSMYVREVQKVDGQLANVPVATYNNVDQFWPMTFDEFESYKYGYKDVKSDLTDCSKLLTKK